jgi:hypothetical protein
VIRGEYFGSRQSDLIGKLLRDIKGLV